MSESDLELAQLLCTRLCHDLAGPVGAVAAGVELIGGDPAQADFETLGLIGSSSAAASAKLKFMRMALGAAGGAGDVRLLLEGYIEATAGPGGKTAVTLPSAEGLATGAARLGSRWAQIVLNLCLLALESVPGCRSLAVAVEARDDFRITILASGAPERTVVLRDDLSAAVAGTNALLSAKTVHGNVAGRLVRANGGQVVLAAAANTVTLVATFPGQAAA
jgi:histidine phosphotransferase ChpT